MYICLEKLFHTFCNVPVEQQCVVFGHVAEDLFFFHMLWDTARIGRQVCHQCGLIDELLMSCSKEKWEKINWQKGYYYTGQSNFVDNETSNWIKRKHTCVNLAVQISHLYGFSPVCILICRLSLNVSGLAYVQWLHWYGRSPVWHLR